MNNKLILICFSALQLPESKAIGKGISKLQMVAKVSIFFFPGNHEKATMRTEVKKLLHLEGLFLILSVKTLGSEKGI